MRLPHKPVVVGITAAVLITAFSGTAQARSIRESSGYTGVHTHFTWAGPSVGAVAWTTSADFVSWTTCRSSTAGITVDGAWNSASLHNGAELDIQYSVERSDGRHFQLGNVLQITKAEPWPGHPAFGGQFRVTVHTPSGLYLKSGTVMSWIVNGGVPWGVGTNSVNFAQSTRSC